MHGGQPNMKHQHLQLRVPENTRSIPLHMKGHVANVIIHWLSM